MVMTSLGRRQEDVLFPSNTGHWVINGSEWEACGDEIVTQDSGMDDKGLRLLVYEFGGQGGGHMLERCLEAGIT